MISDLRAQRLAQERVDVRPGLVEQDELGRGRERAGERDALLLAARELVRVPLLEGLEADDRAARGRAWRARGGEARSRRSPRR